MQRITLAAALFLAAVPNAVLAQPPAPALVAPGFEVPTSAEGPGFRLKPLGPDLVKIDFDAYMSSVEHLQQTFTRSPDWPRAGITDADAMLDMQTEAARFAARKSFAYSVLTPDGLRERGCLYVSPSPVPGYDAVVRIWVTKAEYDAGFDAALEIWARQWIAAKWPFRKVAWPGRSIDWATWDALTKTG
ncbi:twin-arginine translocation pathway signal protein [Novosphingobium sp. PASSN1]|uniref:twin-arginine translocation pathway signal protein n=1 Tax=Novosphingobium sp. PASSN1 TaxID=2015561 RepID=UPI0025CEFC3B|nr:twin-arginine translocation pathway signal protein [Novosphingobium sp. PASSN1]